MLKNFIHNIIQKYKTPEIKENTFLLWEPCSQSHSEMLPGYAKYLLDLGYHVSVIANPERFKEGLFSRFPQENLTLNKTSKKTMIKYLKEDSLLDVKGLLVTTIGKLSTNTNLEEAYSNFHPNTDKKKLLFVEHDIRVAVDNNNWNPDIITLRKMNYKNAKSVVVNPHYFGKVNITQKNNDITNFVTIGALHTKRRNCNLIVNAVQELYDKGYRNFKVTIIGKGHLKGIPKQLHKFFDIKGRVSFSKMYDEIEKADFILTAYEENNEQHLRYNTVGTSGAFQLVYGFLKPCIILESFAPINGFDNMNSIMYNCTQQYSSAMEKGINMSSEEYSAMQTNLQQYADSLYKESLENLKNLINKQDIVKA